MRKAKVTDDVRTQRQKFIDKARELETDDRKETFERTLKMIATAPPAKAKKPPAKKR
jgi:hypothetical protein